MQLHHAVSSSAPFPSLRVQSWAAELKQGFMQESRKLSVIFSSLGGNQAKSIYGNVPTAIMPPQQGQLCLVSSVPWRLQLRYEETSRLAAQDPIIPKQHSQGEASKAQNLNFSGSES